MLSALCIYVLFGMLWAFMYTIRPRQAAAAFFFTDACCLAITSKTRRWIGHASLQYKTPRSPLVRSAPTCSTRRTDLAVGHHSVAEPGLAAEPLVGP